MSLTLRVVKLVIATFLLCGVSLQTAGDPFAYDASAPLEQKTIATRREGTVAIHDLTYASPKGGVVPAYLVLPRTTGRAPAVVFVHWGLGDRHAFLDEAVALGRSGVVSLLIDASFVRPGSKGSEAEQLIQDTIDVRRGIDLLVARDDVDPSRIGFAGLSYGAHIGALLAGSEPRIRALVLAGGLASNGDPNTEQLDAERWVAKPRTAPIFFQFARRDEYITYEQATRFIAATERPAVDKWYEGGHQFNDSARRDRMSWLATVLGFTVPDVDPQPVRANEVPDGQLGGYAELTKFGVVIDVPGMHRVRVRRDVPYKQTPWGELRFDVYYPHALEPDQRVPAIVLISGQAGEPLMRNLRRAAFNTSLARACVARTNRVVIVPDIRPAWTSMTDPAKENSELADVSRDVDDLLQFFGERGAELQLDGSSLAVWVRSAGWSYGLRGAFRSPRVKAIVAYSPRLTSEDLRGTGVADAMLPEFSATAWLDRSTSFPPFLLVTAGHDPFYVPSEVESFLAAAKTRAAPVRHIHLADGEHGFETVNDYEDVRQALVDTFLFLRQHLPLKRSAGFQPAGPPASLPAP